jgi:hypothetical protein
VKRTALASVLMTAGACGFAAAGPVQTPWYGASGESVGAAALSGWYASASTSTDTVEFRDIRGELMGTLDRAALQTLLPWMTLDSSGDGPSAVSMSDSGRLAFVLVHDDAVPGDGLGGDAVIRVDTDTWATSVFTREEFSDETAGHATTALAFYKGNLMVGSTNGVVRSYRANRNDTTGILLSVRTAGFAVDALAVDRDGARLYIGAGDFLFESDAANVNDGMSFVTSIPNLRGLAHSSQFGVAIPLTGGPGLYALDDAGQVSYVSGASVLAYTSVGAGTTDLVATADGGLLAASSAGVSELRESSDGRLGFEDWVLDEFSQVLTYAKGLVSPDGEPAGWVIDADTAAGLTRFHPPSPDAACWTILMLLVADDLHGDPDAQPLVESILTRYAGLAPDGIGPGWSADGITHHWPGPFSTTGDPKPGWPVELASLSTMKLVLGAARAAKQYPSNPEIRAAVAAILDRTTVATFDSYILPGNHAVSLLSTGSSPNTSVTNPPFSEAIIWVDQAADLGTAYSQGKLDLWLDRATSPSATYLTGRPVTTISNGNFMASFVSLYPMLVMDEFRGDPAWQDHVRDLRASQAAWTDDNAPRWYTVFSAGTTKGEFGGYRADSLSNHPGDFSTFPSLMAFAGTGRTDVAVGAYQAYRRGARQNWATGASFLFRRSSPDPAYAPNTAGLPDVALGALGLAELIKPGVIDRVLLGGYTRVPPCPADTNGDGVLDNGDIGTFISLFLAGDLAADLSGDGVLDNGDIGTFISLFLGGCP